VLISAVALLIPVYAATRAVIAVRVPVGWRQVVPFRFGFAYHRAKVESRRHADRTVRIASGAVWLRWTGRLGADINGQNRVEVDPDAFFDRFIARVGRSQPAWLISTPKLRGIADLAECGSPAVSGTQWFGAHGFGS